MHTLQLQFEDEDGGITKSSRHGTRLLNFDPARAREARCRLPVTIKGLKRAMMR